MILFKIIVVAFFVILIVALIEMIKSNDNDDHPTPGTY